MDQSGHPKTRDPRSHVCMIAMVEVAGSPLGVKLRNLSVKGALVEGEGLPSVGSRVVFRRGEIDVPGRIAWASDSRAGIAFDEPLSAERLLRHIPAPVVPKAQPDYRRPGFVTRQLTKGERVIGEVWASRTGRDKVGE